MIDTLLSQTSLPSIHPALVHFPIALAATALLADLFSVLVPRWKSSFDVAVWMYVLAAIGGIASFLSGRNAAASVGAISVAAESALSAHADLALTTVVLLQLTAALRLFGWFLRRSNRRAGGIVIAVSILAMIAANGVLAMTADRGGSLVYRHGVGVEITAGGIPESVGKQTSESDSARSATVVRGSDGSMRWQPLSSDASIFFDELSFADGSSSESLTASSARGSELGGLLLEVQGRSVVLLTGSLGDVAISATADLRQFNGTFGLGHHIHSVDEGVFFTLSTNGETALVRLSDQQRTEMAKEHGEVPVGAMTFRTTVSGRHLKGLVGDRVVVHGHGASGADGSTGLLFDGHGIIEISDLSVEPMASVN